MLGGIEAGGTKFVCAVASAPDRILARERIPTTTPAATLAQVTAFFRAHGAGLTALGLAAFGPLDLDPASPSFGALRATPKPGWSGVPLMAPLQRALGVPVRVQTDVVGAALAEWRLGAARGHRAVLYLTVGTGIGGGALVDGVPVQGRGHAELGHVRVPRAPGDSFAGCCPFHGDCLEGLAAGPALAARCGVAADQLPADHPVWDAVAHYLAHALAGYALVLAPDVIVAGGGVLQTPGLLARVLPRLRAELDRYPVHPAWRDLARFLVPPALPEPGLTGALLLAAQAAP